MRWLVIVVCAGCFTTPPPPDKPPNPDCAAYAQAVCMERDRCSNDFTNLLVYGSEDECEAREVLSCNNSSQITNSGQTQTQFATCISQYASYACDAYEDDESPADCTASGPGANGSPCGVANECKSEFCLVPVNHICGTCAQPPTNGASCASNSNCGHDLACPSLTGICTPYVQLGQPCQTNVAPCDNGLSCTGDTTTTMGVCMTAGQLGDTCDGTRHTNPGCDATVGLSCNATTNGTCVAIPLVGPGAPCGTINDVTTKCIAGGLCVKQAGATTCLATAGDGAACDSDPTIGPKCLEPAACVPSGSGTAGTCTVPDARMCN
jgi:hypothetical protein